MRVHFEIILFLFVIVSMIFVPTIQNSLQISLSDIIETNVRTLTHDPTVCAIQPIVLNDKEWKDVSNYITSAVLDWQTKLKQNPGQRDSWNINLNLFTQEKWDPAYRDKCNIFIHFEPRPLDEDAFQVAGKILSKEIDNILIVIFYLNILEERIESTKPSPYYPGVYERVVEIKYTYADKLMSAESLKLAITHELGHALGLDHYQTWNLDEKQLERWYSGIERPPSVMIPIKPTKVIDASITQLDIEKVLSIYGSDGFSLEPEEIVEQKIPDWIKNNAEWWTSGLISDSDFAMGIQFMIKNEIIVIPNLEKSPSTFAEEIPVWVKNNAKWWADGLISEDDFVNGLQYLVRHGIIIV